MASEYGASKPVMSQTDSGLSQNSRLCHVADLGLIGIPDAENLMTHARELRLQEETPDLLFFMAHPPTVAVGLRDRFIERPVDLLVDPDQLERERIALTRSIRGGGITYHWPGQLVCYPVLALAEGERDVGGYMWRLEQVGMDTLAQFGVSVSRREGKAAYVGLWVDECKLISMGVRISKWVTSFGFAINVGGDHAASSYVRPCGIEGASLATLEEILGQAPPRARVMEAVKDSFTRVFSRTLEPIPADLLQRITLYPS
jgi:lipoate-protein ligase B